MECLSGEQFSWWAQIIVMQSPEIFITKGHINYYFPWKLISFYIPPHSGNLMIYVCTKGDHLKKIHKRWSSKIFVWTKGDLMLFWTCGFRLCYSGLGPAPGHLQFNMTETKQQNILNKSQQQWAKHKRNLNHDRCGQRPWRCLLQCEDTKYLSVHQVSKWPQSGNIKVFTVYVQEIEMPSDGLIFHSLPGNKCPQIQIQNTSTLEFSLLKAEHPFSDFWLNDK